MNKIGLLVFLLLLSFWGQVFGQNVSNEGTDFWSVFPTHVPSSNTTLAEIVVFVTSKYDTQVQVTCGTFDSGIVAVAANTAVGIPVQRSNAYIDVSDRNKTLTSRGIHIVVPEGKEKVSAYAHIYAGNRSAASLILPFETLGQSYYSVNYTQTSSTGANFLSVVAAEDDTNLILHEKSGGTIDIVLPKKGDVYEYLATDGSDLTGVFIETNSENSSCKRFAAFSGSSNMTIGECNRPSGSDPLFQQLYSLSSLGKTYGIVPFNSQAYFYRAVAVTNNSHIYHDGNLVATLQKGEFYTSPRLTTGSYVTSDQNFILSQYMYSVSCSNLSGGMSTNGDPDMVILNSIEFNINNITVFSSDQERIREKYLNVLMKTSKTGSFKINGVVPPATWTPLVGNPAYAYAQIQISALSLTLSADEGFNVIAYGYGQTESYAYSAGTNLTSNNYLTILNSSTSEESQDGCLNENLSFNITLPYLVDYIKWQVDNEAVITQNPSVLLSSKTVGDQTLYTYKSPFEKIFSLVGTHRITAVMHTTGGAACASGEVTASYTFNIYDLPQAKIATVQNPCLGTETSFTDESTTNSVGTVIEKWQWDFGDGTTPSTEKNPKHTYQADGVYTVKLMVKSSAGCYSDVVSKQIIVNPIPVALFAAPAIGCIGSAIIFTNESTISTTKVSTAKITKWHWDFGDNTSIDKTDGFPFTHSYLATGDYQVSLTVYSDGDCSAVSATQTIKITNLPTPDFTVPDICSEDPVATFVNTSTDAAGASGTFTFAWDFGDRYATATNPNTSTDKDAKHKYINPGEYTVRLTIKNENGCANTVEKSFTVNGKIDVADFTIDNVGQLCSNSPVVITNGFTASVGRVIKIEIYGDYAGAPSEISKTIQYPNTTDKIELNYAPFGGNSSRTYTIRIVGYTGDNIACTKEVTKTITLLPVPVLSFAEIPSVCENEGSFMLTQAAETSGISGIGTYSSDGSGVSADGNFNPKVAGAGHHAITYTFLAADGCSSSITSSVEVFQSPTADLGSTLYILAGGEIKIPTQVTGPGLTYKWTPATGLSADNIMSPVASPDQDTEYTLTVTGNPGLCTASSKVLIKVLQSLNPPNSFSPNGDNVNDVWNIKYLESYPNATIEVFNRNGSRVFASTGYAVPFDGTYNNELLPVGVYYYIINPRNGRKIISGPLTIIR
ncbi:PKD domain-containing protein [Pedobacter sp. AW1-32]|uniref:PKD domain-containing protein n=1 Tax=Pedobacter sp. AW1-32 TaxID=3383026 RepID=UPI003FEE92F5